VLFRSRVLIANARGATPIPEPALQEAELSLKLQVDPPDIGDASLLDETMSDDDIGDANLLDTSMADVEASEQEESSADDGTSSWSKYLPTQQNNTADGGAGLRESSATVTEAQPSDDAMGTVACEVPDLEELKATIREQKAKFVARGLSTTEVNLEPSIIQLVSRLKGLKSAASPVTEELKAGTPERAKEEHAELDGLRSELETLKEQLRDVVGFTVDDVELDSDVQLRVEWIQRIMEDRTGTSWKVVQKERADNIETSWSVDRSISKKAAQTSRFQKRHQRRHGELGPCWDNKIGGKIVKERRAEREEWIRGKKRDKKAQRKLLGKGQGAEVGLGGEASEVDDWATS